MEIYFGYKIIKNYYTISEKNYERYKKVNGWLRFINQKLHPNMVFAHVAKILAFLKLFITIYVE